MPTPYLAAMLAESRGAELRWEARTARRVIDAAAQLRAAVARDRAAVCCAAI